ncbi:ABC transporter substrate-binding protein [Streptomyces sp. CA-111067]|uniref:ABC transporter substrate-binding protein n=1 Tax=Streptomyces sp. CA-111067 TaxID=3240046 RepID=UPI003D987D76
MTGRRRARGALALLAVCALALLAACGGGGGGGSSASGGASGSGKVTLDYWTWWPKAPDIVKVWNASHPDIQVHVENVGGGTQQSSKLQAAVSAGQGPDLALAEYEWLPSYISGGIARDITPWAADLRSAYDPAAWDLVALGGGLYGVPLDQAPMALMYRQDLFAKYGIAPPATWQEFAADAAAVHRADPSVVLANYNPTDAEFIAGLARQAGGQWWTNDRGTWSVGIADPPSRQVADFWGRLIASGAVSAESTGTPAANKKINDGKVLSIVGGSWNMTSHNFTSTAAGTIGKWRVAPLPQWTAGDPSVGFAGGSATVVTRTSKHPAQAAQFLSWLGATADGTGAMVRYGGNLPASNVGLKQFAGVQPVDTQAVYGQRDYGQVLTEAAHHTMRSQWGPDTNLAFSDYSDEVGLVVNGHGSLAGALSTVQQAIRDDLKSYGYKVAGS